MSTPGGGPPRDLSRDLPPQPAPATAPPAMPPGRHAAPGPFDHAPPGAPPPAGGPPDVSDVSVGDLMGQVSRDLSTLMRQELALAQAELKQEARKAGKAAGGFGAAGFAGYMMLLFLSVALWAGLSNVMDGGWAGVIVALVWAVIGAIAFVVGRNNARRTHPTPERTVDTLKQVPDALKGR
ncbi:phage holin family protein [Pseudonocardia sp. NPDC049154]|uniref:phage holin family protein n=1 Tax=Pseudonocardia sp. NPDC049154 TaxID=3155501 RepID=UPI00340C2D80